MEVKAPKFRVSGRLVPRPDPALPSAGRMALNLAKAVLQEGAALLTGVPAVPVLEEARRKAVCEKCPRIRTDGRCSLCGCWRDKKVAWRSQRCPENRW